MPENDALALPSRVQEGQADGVRALDVEAYRTCPECGALYDRTAGTCDLHGSIPVPLRPATEQEVRDFERYS